MIDKAQQVLKGVDCSHVLTDSNSHLLNQLTRSHLNSHKEEVVRAREVSSLVMGGQKYPHTHKLAIRVVKLAISRKYQRF